MKLIKGQHIILLGMPGCGKTTTGLNLSKRLNMSFVDTDKVFEDEFQMSITEFWNKKSEEQFRVVERKILLQLLSESCLIIATGGGTPVYMDNMSFINCFNSIYLHIEPEELLKRYTDNTRPLIQERSLSEVAKLYELRKSFYHRAKFIVNAENALEEIVNKTTL
ncbi:MAG: shikimate kinase [Saprospiraceae bacterium]|nr:shikimate kinase [Saprospiraceae bacterium]